MNKMMQIYTIEPFRLNQMECEASNNYNYMDRKMTNIL